VFTFLCTLSVTNEIYLIVYNICSQDEEQQLMHLKLMGWRHFPVNLDKLRGTRCLVLGAGALGCEVSRLLMVSTFCYYYIYVPM
jgi:molybdopterin/thiamine biosynthesis adenylyltransferase